jgi:uncharacterized metal-binding protein YceD (DUF177 family)
MISFSAKELSIRDDKKVSYEIDELISLYEDVVATGKTVGKVEFKLRNNFILVSGEFETPLSLICDRCSTEYAINLKFDIDEAIEINDDPFPVEDLEFTAETIHERIPSTELIDIEDYIRQYIILNLPTKKLCSETCVNDKIDNLNPKEELKAVDPRWGKLISYKDKIKGE